MAATLDHMRRNNQFIVAQLQDEIRLLHGRCARRSGRNRRPGVGRVSHEKDAGQVERAAAPEQAFCILLVRMRSLKQLDSRYSRNVPKVRSRP